MKKISLLAIMVLFVSVMACKKDKKENTETETTETTEMAEPAVVETKTEEVKKIKVALNPKSGSNVSGNAVFREENGTVQFTAIMSGLEPGNHAIHLHETADCSSDDGTSTGGHWNPTAQPHGKWGDEAGYHKGDIGNFYADENGNGTATLSTDEWCIGCGDPAKDIIGKAIIVHQGVDDFTSQPSGAAGARISCAGVIE
ncbi:superoxide dismutase [Hanstruepera neustonica]|uniref:Superoxide dismutase n=1 Tax=Hanstruepera neustonica TaxID=1445657 RepID=A0A2K1DX01_9FLAO|nr:superoxide dismutase family protein [Hanstruepera neustonica]PNQ72523.1 superoxide dismutase [Hanstruepera neustonica]